MLIDFRQPDTRCGWKQFQIGGKCAIISSRKRTEEMTMAKAATINFKEFRTRYYTEEACREELFRQRFPKGFVCPKCGSKEFCVIRSRNLCQCRSCRRQTSVTAGTVMHRTPSAPDHMVLGNLPFQGLSVGNLPQHMCSSAKLYGQVLFPLQPQKHRKSVVFPSHQSRCYILYLAELSR